MNTFFFEITNRTNIFNAQPIVDMTRPTTIATNDGNYIFTCNEITCLLNADQE